MRKKIILSAVVLTIALVAAFNINISIKKSEFSALALSNIEALADNENGTPGTHNHGPTKKPLFGSPYCGNTNQVDCSY